MEMVSPCPFVSSRAAGGAVVTGCRFTDPAHVVRLGGFHPPILHSAPDDVPPHPTDTLFASPGELSRLCREKDWAATPLGPARSWPQSLRTVATVVLGSAVPNIVLWGPELIQIYNDGYAPILGVKHPWGLGIPTRECWPEAWEFNEPIYARVFAGETVSLTDQLYRLRRAGPDSPLEEVYLTISYSPVRDESGGVGGVFITLFDTTSQIAARRLQAERERLLAESEEGRKELERINLQLSEQQVELELITEQLQENAAELEAQTEALSETNQALQASESRLRGIFDQTPIPLAVMTGPEHVYTIVSPRYKAFRGDRPLLGLPFREAFPETIPGGLLDILDRVYETGEPFFATERPVHIDRDGDGVPELYRFDVGYQPLRDADGRVYALVSIAQDVTAQVRARAELEQARAAAEEANRAKSEFLANMSHELRTPLNAIGGYTELMEMGIHGPVTAAQRDTLERVQAAQRHLLTLINDILSYARLEAGRVEFDLEALGARDVLSSLDALIAPQARAKSISYEVHECEPGLRFTGDEERVRQVLLNLVGNAVKFTGAGGRVILRCDADDAWVYLRVEDNGRGVPREKLESIFDPFTQVDRRLDQPQGGVGLGLAISRDLARGMGGDLSAESTPGEGSVFTVRLPLAR